MMSARDTAPGAFARASRDGPGESSGEPASDSIVWSDDERDLAACADDPLRFVERAFHWGEGDLADHAGPDDWQAKVLRAVGAHGTGAARAEALRCAVASGHGVGKSALVAWLILWAMSTRPHLAGVVTANTQAQLETKTWRELALWHKRAVHGRHFKWTASKFYRLDHPGTWFVAAVPWAKERSEAFAGLHARHVLVIYDEASAIPDEIWDVSEGAMTTAGALWFAFGNPTRTTGRFRQCFARFRHRWLTFQVDARGSRLASQSQIERWVADYGDDSDFVRVRVKGVFPNAASEQFIAADVVAAAQARDPANDASAPLVLGVDVARFGDDASVIFPRQGLQALPPQKLRGVDGIQGAGAVARRAGDWRADAIFVDDTGGWGASWIDNLRLLGHAPIGIGFASRPDDPRYENKRTEMYFEAVQWIRDGGAIPDIPELIAALSQTTYSFRGDRLLLEPKEQVKQRLGYSPDDADAFALTFAQKVAGRPTYHDRTMEGLALMQRRRPAFAKTEYDPLELD